MGFSALFDLCISLLFFFASDFCLNAYLGLDIGRFFLSFYSQSIEILYAQFEYTKSYKQVSRQVDTAKMSIDFFQKITYAFISMCELQKQNQTRGVAVMTF